MPLPHADLRELLDDLRRALAAAPETHRGPEAPGAHLVIADALQASGHPRGELIAVQHALATRDESSTKPLRRREAALLADPRLYPVGFASAITADVVYGFPRRLRLDLETSPALASRLEELWWDPSCALLETLELRCRDRGNRPAFDAISASLRRAPFAATLRQLFWGTTSPLLHRCYLGPLPSFLTTWPRLRWVGLRGHCVATLFGEVEAPGWEALSLELESWDRRQLEGLPLAPLVELAVDLPYRPWARTLLERLTTEAPRLRTLGLRGPRCDYPLLRALLEARELVGRLTCLDLREAAITDADVQALMERHPAALAHLLKVDVRGSHLGAVGLAQLASLCRSLRSGRWNRQHDWIPPRGAAI